MKKIAVFVLCSASLFTKAQNIKLETGKKVTAVVTSVMDTDMGAAGQMKIETSSAYEINVISSDDKFYKAVNTVTKMKMSQDGMGQTVNYDSEKKEDAESDMGKQMEKGLNKSDTVLIDKATGDVRDINPEQKEDEDENPMAALMGGDQSPAVLTESAFYVLPANKKIGDKWTDSTTEGTLKITKNYEYQSAANGIATVTVNSVKKGSLTKEIQGMQMEMTVNSNSVTTIATDIKTGLVKNTSTTATIDGSMDVMGQSIPLTMKVNSSATFQ